MKIQSIWDCSHLLRARNIFQNPSLNRSFNSMSIAVDQFLFWRSLPNYRCRWRYTSVFLEKKACGSITLGAANIDTNWSSPLTPVRSDLAFGFISTNSSSFKLRLITMIYPPVMYSNGVKILRVSYYDLRSGRDKYSEEWNFAPHAQEWPKTVLESMLLWILFSNSKHTSSLLPKLEYM